GLDPALGRVKRHGARREGLGLAANDSLDRSETIAPTTAQPHAQRCQAKRGTQPEESSLVHDLLPCGRPQFSHQSEPSTDPSLGWVAAHQVAGLTPEETRRTLPSARAVRIPAARGACGRVTSQAAVTPSQVGATWNIVVTPSFQ